MGSRLLRPEAVFKFAVAIGCLLLSAQSYAIPKLGDLESPSVTSPQAASLARLTVSPVNLSGGSSLTVVSPQAWSALSEVVEKALENTHRRLTNLFGTLPPISTNIRLMTNKAFTNATGAPEWTNALFVRGQILIPIGAEQLKDYQGVSRSVSHEYTHAVVHALSGGRAPGWLDEGLAQWIEGEENPILKPALFEWLSNNDPIPLEKLQGGFTKLETRTVPAAYAQSLLSTTVVLNTFGFAKVREFFDSLAEGNTQTEAMEAAFNAPTLDFEERLYRTLKRWHVQQMQSSVARASVSVKSLDSW